MKVVQGMQVDVMEANEDSLPAGRTSAVGVSDLEGVGVYVTLVPPLTDSIGEGSMSRVVIDQASHVLDEKER